MSYIGTALGSAVVSMIGGAKYLRKVSAEGASQGAASTLNGTAETVRRIEEMVGSMGGKLDRHIAETGRRFDALSESVQDARERVAAIEGSLGATPRKRPARGKK
jgi:hypothetical protein